jgi:iron(III) transport system substrate-binding protein
MQDNGNSSRRRFLAAGATVGAAALAGCSVPGLSEDESGEGAQSEIPSLSSFRGSGTLVEGRPAPGGTDIAELPNLEGELDLYLGGGEGGLYEEFILGLEEIYPDFTVNISARDSASHAQTIIEEVDAGQPGADVFWSIDAGSLATVANAGAHVTLSEDVTGPVPDGFVGADGAWVGVAGRARAIPYNTDELSADDVPNKVADFPDSDALGAMGWAPSYSAFRDFITAMRVLRGRDAALSWLNAMQERSPETQTYGNEFVVSQSVADGAITSGFANHYYAMRVRSANPDAPVSLAFTENDAGALVNVAGALVIEGTERESLANTFVHHLLSAQAQEYFATRTYAYPMIPGVAPVGDLPTVDELNPPEFDLAQLSDIQPTVDLMREAGVR